MIYRWKHYKLLVIIPLVLFIIATYMFFTMDIKKDIDLSGGTSIVVSGNFDENLIKEKLNDIGLKDVKKVENRWEIVYQKDVKPEDVVKRLGGELVSARKISPELGSKFYKQMISALIIAFIFMSLVVFFIFRKIVPSLYVLFAVLADILETFVTTQLLGIPLSLPVISALLLLIGYSGDTDILLTTKGLKREGDLDERIISAFKTGVTMSLTSIGAMIPMMLLPSSEVLRTIATVLFIGLSFDIINTWLMNAVLLKWYLE